mgnify:FL=1
MRYKDAHGHIYYVAQEGRTADGTPYYTVYCIVPGQEAKPFLTSYPTEKDAIGVLEVWAKCHGWQRTE